MKTVVKFPLSSTVRTLALPRPLFAAVPMPKIIDPASVGAPAAATIGNWSTAPLLSLAKKAIGFDT